MLEIFGSGIDLHGNACEFAWEAALGVARALHMSVQSGTYQLRFEFLVSKFFNVAEREHRFSIAGRAAVLRAVHERPLSEDEAVTVNVGGFETEADARDFGFRLQRAATLAGTKADLGVNVGGNKRTSGLGASIRQEFLEKFGVDVRSRVHGIDVYREDVPSRVLLAEGRGSVLTRPDKFLAELAMSYDAWSTQVSGDLEHAIRLRCEANLSGDALAQAVLAIAAVEALAPDEYWSSDQHSMLQALAATALQWPCIAEMEAREVATQLAAMRRLSVGEGFRRLLRRVGLEALWPRWRELYGIRSKVLHGAAPLEMIRDAAEEAFALSKEIVLAAAALEIPGANVMHTESGDLKKGSE